MYVSTQQRYVTNSSILDDNLNAECPLKTMYCNIWKLSFFKKNGGDVLCSVSAGTILDQVKRLFMNRGDLFDERELVRAN